MTETEREEVDRIWKARRGFILENFMTTPYRSWVVDATLPLAAAHHSKMVPVVEFRRYTFDFHQGCLANWEVWYVTCEGELVEYGV